MATTINESNNNSGDYLDEKLKEKENEDMIVIPNRKNVIPALRVEFQSELPKLNDNNTRAQAFTQIKKIISSNTSKEALRIYINSLTSYYTSCSLQGKELIIIAYGYLANIYRDGFLDPLDKPPSIIKTLNRLLSHIRSICLKDNSYVIHKACSHTIIEFLDLCMPKNELKAIMTLFIEPFILLASTCVNLHIKEGSSVYLNDLVYHFSKKKDEFSLNLITNIYPLLIELICKKSSDSRYNYECLLNLLQALPFEYFRDRTKLILCSMVDVLEHKNYSSQTHINCLNVLKVIGKRIFLYQIPLEGKEKLFEAMRSYLRDRNHKVQLAAQEAIKNWNMIQRDYFLNDLSNDQLIRNKKEKAAHAMIRKVNNGKIEEMEQFDCELPEEMREEVYNKGMSDVLKLSSFIKNHSKLNRKNMPYNNNHKVIKQKSNHPNIRKFDEVNQMPFNNDYSNDRSNNKANANINAYDSKFHFLEDTVNGTENAPLHMEETEITQGQMSKLRPMTNQRQSNTFSIAKMFSLMDLNGINNSFKSIKAEYSNLERTMNKKMNLIEEKLISINDYIKQNTYSIINYHYNILDETECDINDKTEIDIPIYDNMPLDDYLNELPYSPSSIPMSLSMPVSSHLLSSTQDNYLLIIWKKALSDIKLGQIENGFNRIVALKDDIYLLRFLLIESCQLISSDLLLQILVRLNKINRSHQMESFLFESIDILINSKEILNQLNKSDIHQLLQTLSEYSSYRNVSIASKANRLYQSILHLFN